MKPSSSDPNRSRAETFLELLNESEGCLGRYTLMMVPNFQDAADILQESKIVMWRNFDDFEIGTNFGAWARKVIYYQVLKYRRHPDRKSLPFSEETLQLLDADAYAMGENLEFRCELLADCIEQLPEEHRQILDFRYRDESPVEEIANSVNRTSGAVYRVLSRIRKTLRDCVSRSIRDC